MGPQSRGGLPPVQVNQQLDIRLLGPMTVTSSGESVSIPGVRERTLLAVLALEAGSVLPADRLVGELWGDEPPPSADHALRVHASALRGRLGSDLIETVNGGYRLVPDDVRLDVEEFERLAAEGERRLAADPAAAAQMLREALDIWRGAALADVPPDLCRPQRTRLNERRTAITERWVDAELAAGRHASVIPELHRLVDETPLREGLQARLMLALYRSGRQAEALPGLRAARRLLTEELGVDPSPELERMQRAILEHDASIQAPSTLPAMPRRGSARTTASAGGAKRVVWIERGAGRGSHDPPCRDGRLR